MAAAGGAASIITQVSQGGPAPINTALGGVYCIVERVVELGAKSNLGTSDENITLELR